MWRGHGSALIVVEEEKHGRSASIHAVSFLGGARPVPAFMPHARGKNGPHLALGILESRNTRLASRAYSPSNVPTRMEAFPTLSFVRRILPKTVEWLPVPSSVEIAHTLVKRGHVFTSCRSAPPTSRAFSRTRCCTSDGSRRVCCCMPRRMGPGRNR